VILGPVLSPSLGRHDAAAPRPFRSSAPLFFLFSPPPEEHPFSLSVFMASIWRPPPSLFPSSVCLRSASLWHRHGPQYPLRLFPPFFFFLRLSWFCAGFFFFCSTPTLPCEVSCFESWPVRLSSLASLAESKRCRGCFFPLLFLSSIPFYNSRIRYHPTALFQSICLEFPPFAPRKYCSSAPCVKAVLVWNPPSRLSTVTFRQWP